MMGDIKLHTLFSTVILSFYSVVYANFFYLHWLFMKLNRSKNYNEQMSKTHIFNLISNLIDACVNFGGRIERVVKLRKS